MRAHIRERRRRDHAPIRAQGERLRSKATWGCAGAVAVTPKHGAAFTNTPVSDGTRRHRWTLHASADQASTFARRAEPDKGATRRGGGTGAQRPQPVSQVAGWACAWYLGAAVGND